MKDDYKEVSLPQVGVNEDHGILQSWLVDEGQYISIGTLICEFETTKTLIEIEAKSEGYIIPVIEESTELKVGETIAILVKDKINIQLIKDNYFKEKGSKGELEITSKITRKAQEFIKKHNLDINSLPIQKKIIRTEDLMSFIKPLESYKKDFKIKIDTKKEPLIIYGAGMGAMTLYEALGKLSEYEVICFIEDDNSHNESIFDIPILHSSKLSELKNKGIKYAACEIANGKIRLRIKKSLNKLGIKLINVIHSNAFISSSVTMGVGNYIKASAVIETNSVIGDCCIIDNGTIIAHDNKIGNGCHIAPGVSLGSSITIDDFSVIGIGASISTNIKIGKNCIVSVGSSVTKDIPDNSIVEGVPGQIIGTVKN